MALLYLYRPIGETNVLGVTGMALGTAILLLVAHSQASAPVFGSVRFPAVVGLAGRLSYELYLFHLVVLGALMMVAPPRIVGGDEKLLLLVVYLALSAALSGTVSRFYAEPLNRNIRQRFVPRPAASSRLIPP